MHKFVHIYAQTDMNFSPLPEDNNRSSGIEGADSPPNDHLDPPSSSPEYNAPSPPIFAPSDDDDEGDEHPFTPETIAVSFVVDANKQELSDGNVGAADV